MRYVFATAPLAALLAIAAAACGGGGPPRPATLQPSPTSSAIDFSALPP
jgi:predicted small lipoprotein YifL